MFSFPINDFVPFVTYCQSMFYMSKILLKEKIMASVFLHFNLSTFTTQKIVHIQIGLNFVVTCIFCGGGTNS